MQIFYINLDRRTDRREFMERQLATLGLAAERVSAVTPDTLPPGALRFCDDRRDQWVAPVELSCTYSHRKIWQMIVERDLPGAIVFEDDAVLSHELPGRLGDIAEGLGGLDVIRLETRLMPVLIEGEEAGWLRRLYSFHVGSAGYAVSKGGAKRLLEHEVHDVPLDDFLFSPEGPMFRALRIRQAYPAFCVTLDRQEREERVSQPVSVSGSDISSEGTVRAVSLQRSRHRLGYRTARYAIRRANNIVPTWFVRSFGEARRASWKRVPFGVTPVL